MTAKLKYICCTLALVAASYVLSGCNDFLEVDEHGKATIPSFLSDPNGLNAGLTGCYNVFYDYVDNEFGKYPDVAGNMSSVNLSSGSAMLDQYNFTPDPTSGLTADYIWRRIYKALANVNNIIQYEPTVENSYPAQKEYCRKILGQALLLRAICHFDLCRTFAQPYNYTDDASHIGVPVLNKTPGANDNPGRKTVKEVYEFIVSDLNKAKELLKDDVAEDYRYGSLQAVNAMLARVYLYMEDWQAALDCAKRTIGNQQPAHGEDYINMYMNLNNRGEAIFRLSGKDMTGHLKTFYSTECQPADTLISLFDTNDLRLKLIHPNGVKRCIKYEATIIPDNQDKREDPIIFRISESYLTAAEAACRLGQYEEARNYIKTIVERAVGSDKADAVMDACSDGELLKLIQTERIKELCFEGHNLFDITRWKQDLVRERTTTSTVKRVNYPSDYFVLPIPRDELNANENMKPNPTVNK